MRDVVLTGVVLRSFLFIVAVDPRETMGSGRGGLIVAFGVYRSDAIEWRWLTER